MDNYNAKGVVSVELVHKSIENIKDAMQKTFIEKNIVTPYALRINSWLKEMHEEFHIGNFYEAGGIAAFIYNEAKHFFAIEWDDQETFNTIHSELEAIQSQIITSVRG